MWARIEMLGHRRIFGQIDPSPSTLFPGLIHITTPLADGTFQHCWISPSSVYQITELTEEKVMEALAPYTPPALDAVFEENDGEPAHYDNTEEAL